MMTYANFDLEAFDYTAGGDGESFSVRVADSPTGQQRISDGVRVQLPRELRRHWLPQLERRMLGREEMIEFGRMLGDALFPSSIRQMLMRSRDRLGEGGLRIRLKFDAFALSDLPWEFAYVPGTDSGERGPECFLSLDRGISFVRYEVIGQAPGTLDPVPGSQLRFVALMSNPSSPQYPQLDLNREGKMIREALTDAPDVLPELFDHATLDVLEDALRRPAHIFHFAGHGEFQAELGERVGSVQGRGYLVLMDEAGGPFLFAADKLARTLAGRGVRLAMLGACQAGRRDGVNPWTGVAPALTRAGIPAVVGMQFAVRDQNAVTFNRRFYRDLAAGLPIDLAVMNGRNAIFNRGDDDERDWGTPVLYMRADEGVLFPRPPAYSQGKMGESPASGRSYPDSGQYGRPSSVYGQSKSGVNLPNKIALRSFIVQQFSRDELQLLCVDLSASVGQTIDLDIIGGSTKEILALNLIGYMERRGLYAALVEVVRQSRPGLM